MKWGNIIGLNFAMNFLKGQIPASLSQCWDLICLSLDVSSPIPWDMLAALVQDHSLREIDLMKTSHLKEAPLPAVIGAMTNVEVLRLRFLGLTGPIPDLSGNTALKTLDLCGNKLTGDIPWDSFSSLVQDHSLREIALSSNRFEVDTIPLLVGTLTNLVRLELADLGFRGPISAELCRLPRLECLDLSQQRGRIEAADVDSDNDKDNDEGN